MVEGLFYNNEFNSYASRHDPQQHGMHWITDNAVSFIKAPDERPYYLVETPNIPHSPPVLETLCQLAFNSSFLSENPDVQPPFSDILDRLDALWIRTSEKHSAGASERSSRDQICGWTMGLAQCWMLLMLEETRDNTIIAFTTDHLARGKMTLHRQFVPLEYG